MVCTSVWWLYHPKGTLSEMAKSLRAFFSATWITCSFHSFSTVCKFAFCSIFYEVLIAISHVISFMCLLPILVTAPLSLACVGTKFFHHIILVFYLLKRYDPPISFMWYDHPTLLQPLPVKYVIRLRKRSFRNLYTILIPLQTLRG